MFEREDLKDNKESDLDDLNWDELRRRLDEGEKGENDNSSRFSLFRSNWKRLLALSMLGSTLGFLSLVSSEVGSMVVGFWSFLVMPRIGLLPMFLVIIMVLGMIYGLIVPKYYSMKKVVFLGNPSKIFWVSEDDSSSVKVPFLGSMSDEKVSTGIKETKFGTVVIKPSKSMFNTDFIGFSIVVEKTYRHGYGNWIFISASLPDEIAGKRKFEDGENYPYLKAEPINMDEKEKIKLNTKIEVLQNKLAAKEEHIEEAYELLRELEEQPLGYAEENLRKGMDVMEDALTKLNETMIKVPDNEQKTDE